MPPKQFLLLFMRHILSIVIEAGFAQANHVMFFAKLRQLLRRVMSLVWSALFGMNAQRGVDFGVPGGQGKSALPVSRFYANSDDCL